MNGSYSSRHLCQVLVLSALGCYAYTDFFLSDSEIGSAFAYSREDSIHMTHDVCFQQRRCPLSERR